MSLISSVASDFTFTTSSAPSALHERGDDLVRLGRVARPVDDAAGGLDGRLQLDEHLVEPAEGRILDRRTGLAQGLPVGHLGHDGGALGADRACRVADVGPDLGVRERSRGRVREALGPRIPGCAAHEARISARCTGRTSMPRRWRPPPMCIRHELSQAHTAPAPLATTAASFSSSIAVETSAFLTANVPPKPQHSSASGSSTSSTPGAARSSRSGASPTRSSRSEWQVGWYATVPS